MADEPTNKDLMDFMGKVAEDVTDIKDNMATKADLQKIENRLETIEDRFQVVENKIDKALFSEIDRHERWIRKIAEKVGVELER